MDRLARVLSSVAAMVALVLVAAVSLVLLLWLVVIGLVVGVGVVVVRGVRRLVRPLACGSRGNWEGRRNVRVMGVVVRGPGVPDSGLGA